MAKEIFAPSKIRELRLAYSRLEKIDPASDTYHKLKEKIDAMPFAMLHQISISNIKWLSMLAQNRVNSIKRKGKRR